MVKLFGKFNYKGLPFVKLFIVGSVIVFSGLSLQVNIIKNISEQNEVSPPILPF